MIHHSSARFSTKLLNPCNVIIFLTCITLGNAVCKSSYFRLYSDRYLPNHVIKTVVVTSQVECTLQCLRRDDCKSWNLYETASGLNCELNNATVDLTLESNLLRRDGAKFGHRFEDTENKEVTTDLF